MKAKLGEKSDAVLRHLRSHPDARPRDIAAATGISSKKVSDILHRIRTVGPHKSRRFIVIDLNSNDDVFEWLNDQCPTGLSLGEFVAAIIVDAMNEEV